jgi:hypothetical protein
MHINAVNGVRAVATPRIQRLLIQIWLTGAANEDEPCSTTTRRVLKCVQGN